MSQTIENRIVEMQFENKQFESGVQESLSTLDKLKNALKCVAKNLGNFHFPRFFLKVVTKYERMVSVTIIYYSTNTQPPKNQTILQGCILSVSAP